MDNNKFNDEETLDLLKEISHKDFMAVGLHQVAYIKRLETSDKTSNIFSVHAADGSQISIMNSYDMAVDSIRGNDLFPVTVH